MPILHIFDFDQTVTIFHTFDDPLNYTPQNNLRRGLENYIRHDNDCYLAIATFHSDPDYVLAYLLSLIKVTPDFCKKEAKTHHLLSKYYFNNNPIPLIISTIHQENHRYHLSALGNKNRQIQDIIAELPFCDKHHFFDDNIDNIQQAVTELKTVCCHQVLAEHNPTFSIVKSFYPE